MADETTRLGITQPEVGDTSWGTILRTTFEGFDAILGGASAINLATLSGNVDPAEPTGLKVVLSGACGGAVTLRFARAGIWFIYDGSTAFTVSVGGVGGSAAALTKGHWHVVQVTVAMNGVVSQPLQAYNANLAAFAGLTLIADRLPYADGSGTLALATFTAAGRAILDDADASAQRTTLGVAIGTNVQAYSALLAAHAALSDTSGTIEKTGAATVGVYTVTAAGKALIDDADASAQRTTLGLGSLATASSVNGSNWSGTDLAVGDGGSGASTAAGARTNFGIGSIATRDLTISTSSPSGGADGDVWFKYTA